MLHYTPFSDQLTEGLKYFLGKTYKPFDPSTKRAINKYNQLVLWEQFTESIGVPKEDSYPTHHIFRSNPNAPVPPRFQTFGQLQSFRDNMSVFLNDNRWLDPDPANWILLTDLPRPVDMKYWTIAQKVDLQKGWNELYDDDAEKSKIGVSEIINHMTFDQREAYGLLTKDELISIDDVSKNIYKTTFATVEMGLQIKIKTIRPGANKRNPMSYRNTKIDQTTHNYTGKLFED